MQYLAEKASNAAKELSNAEKKVQSIAKATGVQSAQAAILSKNYETLSSAATSASDKFGALKQNLDILSKGSMTFTTAQKGLGQALDDTAKGMKALADESGGSLNQFYALGKGFDFATKGGRDLHTSLESSTDAILKIGTAALDKAIKGGMAAGDANKVALTAMQPSIAALRKNLSDLGVEAPKIDEIVKSFGLLDEQIVAGLTIEGTEEAQRKIFLTKLAADTYASGNYTGVLAALPDNAKKAIEDTTGLAGAFARGDYDAILKALDGTAGGRAAALASILATTNGDYAATMKALDGTRPGRAEAEAALRATVNSSYMATLKAQGDPTTINATQTQLNNLAVTRYATFVAQWKEVGRPAGLAAAQDGVDFANGGIMKNNVVQRFANGGFNGGMLKSFANGSEKHVAQFAKAGAMRLWAEPETGGEAYIPLAKNKRAASLKILEQVAKIFGFGLHQMQMADGGTSASASVASPVVGSGDNIEVNIFPSPGLSSEQIGEAAIDHLFWKLANK
jgi:hypothetical protein